MNRKWMDAHKQTYGKCDGRRDGKLGTVNYYIVIVDGYFL